MLHRAPVSRRRRSTHRLLRGLGLTGIVIALGMARAPGTPAEAASAPRAMHLRTSLLAATRNGPGEDTFAKLCVPCHGKKGKGDGPAAVAFNPPPADFSDPDGVAKLSDEEVLQVITNGRASMPAFGPVLSDDVLTAVVAYLRELTAGAEE